MSLAFRSLALSGLIAAEDVWEQEREELEFRMQTAISSDLDEYDYLMGNW